MRQRRPAIAAIAAVGLAVAACGGGDPDRPGSGSGDASEAEIDRDARLVYASCCPPTTLDPHNQPAGGVAGWFMLYDRLTMAGTPEDPAAPEISPMLAESWEYAEDGLTLTFHLRDDVTFHDGSPVDAEAVRRSIERARESTFSAATALENVEAVEAVDDRTVQLTLSRPDATLPASMASHAGAVINPAVLDDPNVDLDLAPPPEAGSGPYVATGVEPNNRATFERAEGEYWDPEASHAAEIELLGVADPTTRLNGLRGGDYDVIQLVSLSTLEGDRLAESGDFVNHHIDGRTVAVAWLRHTNPAVEDVRVRQAIAMAVDREGIAEGALNGTCTATDQFFAPDTLGYDPDFENPYPYDPDEAAALLDEAGVDLPLEIDVVVPAGSTQETIGTALQASLREVGIEAAVQAIPPNDTVSEFVGGGYDASINAIVAAPDPGTIAATELYNRTGLAEGDREIARLLEEGRSELDEDARAAVYQDINQYVVADEVWAVPVCLAQFGWAAQANVVNVDRMPWQWTAMPDTRYLGVTR